MATFSINSSVNIDTLTSKAGFDSYNITGSVLTIDQDSRYGLNQTTSSCLGNVNISLTAGGSLLIDGTLIRLIPFNTGTGNVPSYNTVISIGGASGKLIGVYSALNVAPTSPGSAMPSSGFIKIKQWNNVAYSSGSLSGIGANCTGPDVVGWLEIVGQEAGVISIPRLGSINITGSYYEIGVTTGIRSSSYQIPSNGSLQYHAGVEVEISSGSNTYEFYPCVGSLKAVQNNIGIDEIRGKVCWINTSGSLYFGSDGVNTGSGYVPTSNRRIRISNIFLVNCTSGAKGTNALPNATLGTRYRFNTSNGGVVSIDKASICWQTSFTTPFSLALKNVGVCTQIQVTKCATKFTWDNVNVGQEAANTQISLLVTFCLQGCDITNSIFSRATLPASTNYVVSISDCENVNFTNCKFISFVKAANAGTASFFATRSNNFYLLDCIYGGSKLLLVTCSFITIKDMIYYDNPGTYTKSTIAVSAVELQTSCTNCLIDGLTFGNLIRCQPYLALLTITGVGCKDIKFRNVGSYNTPLDLGYTEQLNVSWSRVTTTCTVTSSNHGLSTNDTIWLTRSSVGAGTMTLTAKTVTVIDANTFTFAVTNTGATSGTLSYFPSITGYLVNLAGNSASNNIKIQRCYCTHARLAPVFTDNTSNNVIMESVYAGDRLLNATTVSLNSKFKNIQGLVTSQASACYGVHFITNSLYNYTPNTIGQAWSRVSSTCTVVSNNHNLVTSAQIIVLSSSSESTITLNVKTITVVDENTFTFFCNSSGPTSGTLDYQPLSDRLNILFNEATENTSGTYTINSGSPSFTSAGGLYMPNVGDSITYETPDYLIEYTNFIKKEVVLGGGNITDYNMHYYLNTGSGYSSKKNLSYIVPLFVGNSGSTSLFVSSTSGVLVGDYVYAPSNLASNVYVTAISGSTELILSKPHTGSVSGPIRFVSLSNDPDFPSTGVKIKIDINTINANTSSLTNFRLDLLSTDTTRARQYPLDLYKVTLTGLKNPSEVRIFNASSPLEEINGSENITTGEYEAEIDAITYPLINIAILSLGYQNIRLTDIDISDGDIAIPIQQQIDRQYSNL